MNRCTAFILLTALVAHGCTRPNTVLKAPLPATAEGLSHSTWKLDDIVLEFGTPPELTITGKGTPFGKPLKGSYTVQNGIVEITALGHTRAGTWNGRAMVIDGMDAEFVSKG